MKKRLFKNAAAIVISAVTALGLSVGVSAKEFPDVPRDGWFYSAVNKWGGDKYNVLTGDENGLFNPDEPMTIGGIAHVLAKTFGYTEKAEATFNKAGKYYENSFPQAVAAGIMGVNANPEAFATRELAIRYIALAFDIKPVEGKTAFVDNDAIGKTYVGYVKAFLEKGYISPLGTGGGNFEPKGSFTRAQVMKLLDNVLGDITDKSVTGGVVNGSLIIRAANTTLTDVVVNGDLIVAQGVGDGDVTLDGVTVTGRLIAYGGGSHSIHIKGKSHIKRITAKKTFGEPLRLDVQVDEDADKPNVDVEGNSNTILDGAFGDVNVNGPNANVEIAKNSKAGDVSVGENAANSTIKDNSATQATQAPEPAETAATEPTATPEPSGSSNSAPPNNDTPTYAAPAIALTLSAPIILGNEVTIHADYTLSNITGAEGDAPGDYAVFVNNSDNGNYTQDPFRLYGSGGLSLTSLNYAPGSYTKTFVFWVVRLLPPTGQAPYDVDFDHPIASATASVTYEVTYVPDGFLEMDAQFYEEGGWIWFYHPMFSKPGFSVDNITVTNQILCVTKPLAGFSIWCGGVEDDGTLWLGFSGAPLGWYRIAFNLGQETVYQTIYHEKNFR